jgi:hypothetical protein
MSEKAKKGNFDIALNDDGAPLDNTTGHMTIGFKICDNDAIDPITGRLIYNENIDGPNLKSTKTDTPVTSSCPPFIRTEAVPELVLMMEEVPELGWLPFYIPQPQYMNYIKLRLGHCGACGESTYFCHLFQLHSESVQIPN